MANCKFIDKKNCFYSYYLIIYLVDVLAYVLKELIQLKKINYVYPVILNVVHVEMLVKSVVLVVNPIYFSYMMQWLVLNLVLNSIIPVRIWIKNSKSIIFFNKIVNFGNVFVVKQIAHHVIQVLIYVHHVPMVMLLKIQIVSKQHKRVNHRNILIL